MAARHPSGAGADDAACHGGFVRRRQDGHRPAGGQKPRRRVPSARRRRVRPAAAGHAAARHPARRLRRGAEDGRAVRPGPVFPSGRARHGLRPHDGPAPLHRLQAGRRVRRRIRPRHAAAAEPRPHGRARHRGAQRLPYFPRPCRCDWPCHNGAGLLPRCRRDRGCAHKARSAHPNGIFAGAAGTGRAGGQKARGRAHHARHSPCHRRLRAPGGPGGHAGGYF